MSASDKKRLRKEQAVDMLTEKQRQEKADAKKLKVYTIAFVSTMVLIACIALGILGVRAVNQSGVIQKNTIAATIGDRELNTVEMNYYFSGAISEFYNQWYESYSTYTDTYLQALGLDTTQPLDEQFYDEESGQTWADYFVDAAIEQAANDYALYDAAMNAGFTLPDEEQITLDNTLSNLETYATIYGYSSADKYLSAIYGYGADTESYRAYCERSAIADAYYSYYEESLTYDDAAIREYEADKFSNYTSFDYTQCYMSYTYFLQGGTEDEEGNVTYSDEEKDAARTAMTAAATQLSAATSAEEMEQIAAQIEVSEDSSLSVDNYECKLYTSINTKLSAWLAEEDRQVGDVGCIENTSTSETDDGEEVTVINGYYVVIFNGFDDNTDAMADVRTLLVAYEGGTEDEETGELIYSDDEIAAAKTAAEEFLQIWKDGDATEDSFSELAVENSTDATAEDGGLYENINTDSDYIFTDWALSSEREAGNTEIIACDEGYYIVYFVGNSDLTYRDYMITNDKRAEDLENWYNALVDAVSTSKGNTSKMNLDTVISSS